MSWKKKVTRRRVGGYIYTKSKSKAAKSKSSRRTKRISSASKSRFISR